jgi:hypothetical protein
MTAVARPCWSLTASEDTQMTAAARHAGPLVCVVPGSSDPCLNVEFDGMDFPTLQHIRLRRLATNTSIGWKWGSWALSMCVMLINPYLEATPLRLTFTV